MADDDLDHRLARLPPRDLDDFTAERVRRRAQSALAEERRLARCPWLVPLAHAWSRAVTPALLASTACAYLLWALRLVDTLYR